MEAQFCKCTKAIDLKWVSFLVCKLYLDKVINYNFFFFFKKDPTHSIPLILKGNAYFPSSVFLFEGSEGQCPDL